MIQGHRHPAAPPVVRCKVLSGVHTQRISEKGLHKQMWYLWQSLSCPIPGTQFPWAPSAGASGAIRPPLCQPQAVHECPWCHVCPWHGYRFWLSSAWLSSYSWTLLNNFIWLLSKEGRWGANFLLVYKDLTVQILAVSSLCCFIPVSVDLWQKEIHECKISLQIFTHLWILETKRQQHSTDANTRINLFINLCWYWIGKHL